MCQETDKLTCLIDELSCDRENIALYTKYSNEEMVFKLEANATEALKNVEKNKT